jgi:4-hydroxy-4-methyl-2-oxoglutarate aldolase
MSEPAALTIRRDFPRPDPTHVAGLVGVPTGFVADAQGRQGALDWRIRPLTRAQAFAGVALTVRTRSRDNLAPWAAIGFARPGDVLVIETGDYTGASTAGDLVLGMARNRGVVALVTDGLVRDIAGLDEVGLPVFARGLSPNSPFKDGPGEIGLSVSIGGSTVTSGDMVVGDANGVVVVPRERAGEVVAALAAVRAKEAKMDALVASGATAPPWLEETMKRLNVRWVD